MASATRKDLLKKVYTMVPPMLESFHKGKFKLNTCCIQVANIFVGQLGRVAVIGGSEDYTGAPYFSAMASAKLGCDMVHITHLETVVETKLMKCSLT
jgi:ATP-dependent NAD(P)H-hydrate dehydratase